MLPTATEALRKWLKQKGWDQKTLALRLSLPEARVSRIMTGEVRPTLEQAARIHELTGLRPERWVA